jgi:hypothetical protein
MCAAVLLPALLLVAQPQKQEPPPLTDAQKEALQTLIRSTEKNAKELQGRLEQRQRELAKCYADFRLDEAAVGKLQGEVVELQRQLLANYHRLQVELRKIVGEERFVTLRQRIDRILGMSPPPKEKK